MDRLIAQLADPDADLRAGAEKDLLRIGAEARPAVVAASRVDDPAIASAASRVLLAMPWHRADDPPAVRRILLRYGQADATARAQMLHQLANLDDGQGAPALLRLILEDPSEDVCWRIVSMFHGHGRPRPIHDPRFDEAARQLDPDDHHPAALMLAARGWLLKDHARALDLFRRSIHAASRVPAFDDGELDFAFDKLVLDAIGRRNFDEAAELRRRQTDRIGATRGSYPSPVYALFALHAHYGPLSGFEDDLIAYEPYLAHPQVIYALSRICVRSNRPVEALALEQTARSSSITMLQRYAAAVFLESAQWTDLSRREAYAALTGFENESIVSPRFQLRSLLLRLATAEELDAAAIEHLNELSAAAGSVEAVASEVAWRTARLALRQDDAARARQELQRWAQLNTSDSEAVLGATPLLRSLGMNDLADAAFDRIYAETKQSLQSDPDNPMWMNQLAWINARCDRNLDEALELANRAVQIDPNSAAYLDTLAEVHFRRGNAAEAVIIERRALLLHPEDVFMVGQLQRFDAAADRKP